MTSASQRQLFHPARLVAVITLAMLCLPGQLFAATSVPAHGDVEVQSMRQEDLDGDTRPDVSIIRATVVSASNTTQLEVRVYDGGHNSPTTTDWRAATDFVDDTWVFDFGADGSAQFVMTFSRDADTTTARLYTDQTGDGSVALSVRGAAVAITETPFPSLTVIALGNWFLPDGRLNWNVRFVTDGEKVEQIYTYNLLEQWRPILPLQLDGKPDVELEFNDANHDGVPEYGLWRLIAPTPASAGATRSWLWSNEGRHLPQNPEFPHFLFWPYLSLGSTVGVSTLGAAQASDQRYFDTAPTIGIIPSRLYLAFSGYPIEEGFHVNTLQPFTKASGNYADFENAQAFYDLAGDKDNSPELHIRLRHYDPGDPYGFSLNVPTNEIRWSWNQSNAPGLSWDYKLGLAGRQAITSEVAFPDFSYRTIPYADLPSWVVNNRWDYGTFVAAESASFVSTEGIYTWGPIETAINQDPSLISRYLGGEADIDLATAFQTIAQGFRGEFAAQLSDHPMLYFSPIDQKLHLRDASQGVWNLGEDAELRVGNLDGDPYLDQWRYVVHGEVRRQLNQTSSHLLYSGENEVRIKRVSTPQSLFETLPPRNQDEWSALGEQLGQHQAARAPGDLSAFMQQFAGSEMQITGATMEDFRPLGESGFRFLLTLQPGFAVYGQQLLDLTGASPGQYIITYGDSGRFTVEPLTPPKLSAVVSAPTLHKLEMGNLRVELQNTGLQDITQAEIELVLTSPGGKSANVPAQPLELLGQNSATVTFQWAPQQTGAWAVAPRIHLPDNQTITLQATSVNVLPGQTADVASLTQTTALSQRLPLVLCGIAVLAILAGLAFRFGWQTTAEE